MEVEIELYTLNCQCQRFTHTGQKPSMLFNAFVPKLAECMLSLHDSSLLSGSHNHHLITANTSSTLVVLDNSHTLHTEPWL